MQECVTDSHSIEELKLQLIPVWCNLELDIIEMAINDQWCRRLPAFVHMTGSHLEHIVWTNSEWPCM